MLEIINYHLFPILRNWERIRDYRTPSNAMSSRLIIWSAICPPTCLIKYLPTVCHFHLKTITEQDNRCRNCNISKNTSWINKFRSWRHFLYGQGQSFNHSQDISSLCLFIFMSFYRFISLLIMDSQNRIDWMVCKWTVFLFHDDSKWLQERKRKRTIFIWLGQTRNPSC